jgi:hypothetical protein
MYRTNSDESWIRLGQGFIPFLDDFRICFKHKLCNGECIALPRRRANMKDGLGVRRIKRHHGERNCHNSLECLRGSPPLIDLFVP